MNRVLVLYDSKTGNTAKMATLVAEGASSVPDTEVRVKSVDEATADDVVWCDGLAVGSPTNMGILSWKMKRFWDETMGSRWLKVDGKIACAFSTAGGWGGGSVVADRADEFWLPRIWRHRLRRPHDDAALWRGGGS